MSLDPQPFDIGGRRVLPGERARLELPVANLHTSAPERMRERMSAPRHGAAGERAIV